MSKGIFCHLRLKNLYSLGTFPDFEQKAMEFNEFFLKNSQNWIVRVQRKVYPGESILKVRENTEHFLDFEPNLFVTVVRTAIHASRKKTSGKSSFEKKILWERNYRGLLKNSKVRLSSMHTTCPVTFLREMFMRKIRKTEWIFPDFQQNFSVWLSKQHSTCPDTHYSEKFDEFQTFFRNSSKKQS